MSRLRIRELVRKEFILLFRDPRSRRVLVVAPIGMLLLFGYVVNYDIRHIRVALLDQSHTRESRMIADALSANKIFTITHVVEDQRDIDTLLLKGKIDLGVKLGPDLSRHIRKGETAEIQILADGSMSNMASIRIAYTVMVNDKLNRELIRELHPQRMDYGKIDGRIRTWYNPLENPFNGEVLAVFDIGGNDQPVGEISYHTIGGPPNYPITELRAQAPYLAGTGGNPFRHQHPQLAADPNSGVILIGFQARSSSVGYPNGYAFVALDRNGGFLPSQFAAPYFLADSFGLIDTAPNYHNLKYDPFSDSFLVAFNAENPEPGGSRITYLASVSVTYTS